MRGHLIALLMFVFVPVAACGDAAPAKVVAGHDTADDTRDADDTAPGSASTACAVFVDHCVRCHDSILAVPDLRPGTQASLVGASSGYPGNTLVVAGDPDASFLFRKMAGTHGSSEGTAMPPTEGAAGTELEVVRGWIAAGAADDCDGTESAR